MRSKEIRPGLEEVPAYETLKDKPIAKKTKIARQETQKSISGEVEKTKKPEGKLSTVSFQVPDPKFKLGHFYTLDLSNGYLLFEVVGFKTKGTWELNTNSTPSTTGKWDGNYSYLGLLYPGSTLRGCQSELMGSTMWIDEKLWDLKDQAVEVEYLGKRLDVKKKSTPLTLEIM